MNTAAVRPNEVSTEIVLVADRVPKRVAWWLLLLYVATFPVVEGISNSMLAVGTRMSGAVLAGVWAIETVAQGRIRFSKGMLFIVAFLLWSIASLLWSADEAATIERASDLAQVLILYWIVLDLSDGPHATRLLLLAYMIGVGLLAISAAANVVSRTGYNGYENRFSAIGTDPNNFGVMMASAIACSLVFTNSRSLLATLAVACYATAGAALILASASRTALIALGIVVIGFAFAPTESGRRAVTRISMAAVVIALLVILAPVVVPEQSLDRLSTAFTSGLSNEREIPWRLAISLGSAHAGTGVGAGTFYQLSGTHLSEAMEAHSTFLLAFAELGLPGFVLWTGIWVWHFAALRRPFRSGDSITTLSVFLALSATLMAALTLNWQVRKPLYLLWALAAAVASTAAAARRPRTSDQPGLSAG